MRRAGRALAVAILSVVPGFAEDPAGDVFTFHALAQPQGAATASYLRMRHPLYLLDLCRQVKAGTLERNAVEPLVGRRTLDALQVRDLDALAQKLTDPAVPTGEPAAHGLWHRILTDDETAPLPPPDVPEELDFHDVGQGDNPTRTLHVASPGDGLFAASLPAGSPFRIVSMRTSTGVLVAQPPPPRPRRARTPRRADPVYQAPEISKQQPPWVVPVQAGQDVDVTVGLPVDAAVPPGEAISSTITVGDPVQGLWRQDVPLLAQSALKGDIKLTVDMPEPLLDVVSEVSYFPYVPRMVIVPLRVSNPTPPVTVQGSVTPLSLPPGVSMAAVNFTLLPQQSLDVSFALAIDRQSPTWLQQEVPRPFSVRVSYHTTSVPLASRAETADFYLTVHPATQSWYATGGAGGVKCAQDLVVYATGTTSRSGWCDNRNAYNAKVVSQGDLALPKVVYDVYMMGWFDGPRIQSSVVTIPYFAGNYVAVRGQPLFMSWTRY
jgi:hypothetical protein